MRVLLALLLLAPAGPGSPLADLGIDDPQPTQWVVRADPPDPLPAGDQTVVDVTVHREVQGRPVAGPGQAEVSLRANPDSGCGPREQTVSLDPATGRGQARLRCTPERPGRYPLTVTARSRGSRPGAWTADLVVEPDRLTGSLQVGQPAGYQVPIAWRLEPEHLASAPVDLTLEARLANASLGVDTDLGSPTVAGQARAVDWTARHGAGTYDVTLHASGPLTRNWSRSTQVVVPQPDASPELELNATVEAGTANVTLTDDAVNANGKTKRPGDRLITRLSATGAERVNVTVLRAAGNGTVTLNETTVAVDDAGRAEHVFQHDPLPAGPLWVQAEVGQASVARTAQISDLEASAEADGPEQVLADGRAWQGNLTLRDPNFGSTPADPGPVFGLPNVTWTVYHGTQTADGFEVQLGPFQGPSEGRAATARVPWPSGAGDASAGPGWARFPVQLRPPADVAPGSYRWSLYAPDGDRIGGARLDLLAPPEPSLSVGSPRPGAPLGVNVSLENAVPGTATRLDLVVENDTVDTATVNGTGQAQLDLPAPLSAGTSVALAARSDWPGRPETRRPDDVVRREVPDVDPTATVQATLDGHPAPVPVPTHPAANHTLELAYSVRDPNTGPLNATVEVTGPDGPAAWPVEDGDDLARIEVPADAPAGRYEVRLVSNETGAIVDRVPVDRIRSVRLSLSGPDAVTLEPGANRSVNLTVTNRGSLAVREATLLVETPLDLEATVQQGGHTARAGRPVPVDLPPGGSQRLQLALEAHGSGQGPVNVTVAGVAP